MEMTKLLLINNAMVYTPLSVSEVRQYLVSGKTGCIKGYLDSEGTQCVEISLRGVLLVADESTEVPVADFNVIMYTGN